MVSISGLALEDTKSSLAELVSDPAKQSSSPPELESGPARQGTDGLPLTEVCRHSAIDSWFFRGFFVALFCLEKQCSGLFRYFFVVFSWLFRGFGQILRVLALEQSSD